MADFIFQLLHSGSYLAVFFLMLAENIFPPIPSEAVLPLTGIAVAEGHLTLLGAIIASVAGSVLGTSMWFLLGRYLSVDRIKLFLDKYGVFVAVSVNDFQFVENIFRRFSSASVFFCRLLPTLRTLISLPAGSIKMNIPLFYTLTISGTLIWNTFLISVGMGLESFMYILEVYLNPAVNILIIFFLFLYFLQIIRFWYTRLIKPKV